jgi:catechol 2,3-dioxygenase
MPAVPLSPGAGLDPSTRIGAVALTVADLDRMVHFYESAIGLQLARREDGRAALGAGDEDLLLLVAEPGARPAAGRHTGLFHTAFLVPSRPELARSLRRLMELGTPMTGFSDHLVSEAIYLDDPEGNGIEIYRDRPREEWPLEGEHLRMSTDPLDVEGVLAEADDAPERVAAGTVVGHVHLRVADVPAAEAFYRDVVGLDVMVHYPGATFLAAGGYHHHLGANQWGSAGAPPPPPGSTGLHHYELRGADVAAVAERAGKAAGEELLLSDPSGNRVVLRR